MKYCPYCGAAIPDGAVVFCVECGKELPKRLDKPKKANVDKGTPSAKQKQRKKRATADEEYRRAYNEGYDGYYEDVLPVDYGQERFETDSFPVKKVITVAVGAIVLISLCVLMLYHGTAPEAMHIRPACHPQAHIVLCVPALTSQHRYICAT